MKFFVVHYVFINSGFIGLGELAFHSSDYFLKLGTEILGRNVAVRRDPMATRGQDPLRYP